MSPDAVSLLNQVLALPPEERERFADCVYESLSEDSPEEIQTAWDEEIKLRIEEIDRGEVTLIPWEQVQAELHARLKR